MFEQKISTENDYQVKTKTSAAHNIGRSQS